MNTNLDSGVIIQKLFPVTYLIKCGRDIVWKWNINQIIDRLDKHELTIPEIVYDNTLVTPHSDKENFKLIENNVSQNMTNKSLGIKPRIINS